MKKIKVFTIALILLIPLNIHASSLLYNIEINGNNLNDTIFSEKIIYEMEDQQQVVNGYNELYNILNNEKKATKDNNYNKTITKSDGVNHVEFSYQFLPATFGNAFSIKRCLGDYNFSYNNSFYTFTSNSDFYCNYTDEVIITVISNRVVETNGTKISDDTYRWNLSQENTSNISIKIATTDEVYKKEIEKQNNNKRENEYSGTIYFLLIFISLGLIALIIYLIYRIRNKKLNQI